MSATNGAGSAAIFCVTRKSSASAKYGDAEADERTGLFVASDIAESTVSMLRFIFVVIAGNSHQNFYNAAILLWAHDTPPANALAQKRAPAGPADLKQFGQRGEGWLAAQLITIAMVFFPPRPLQGVLDVLGWLALAAGGAIVIYSFVSLGKNLSPLPEPRKKHALVTTGMYRYARHPMYGGSLVGFLGLAAVTRDEMRLAMTVAVWFVLERKVACEEQMLSARYPEYEQYKARVKKFFPFVY